MDPQDPSDPPVALADPALRALLEELGARGIELEARGDRLGVRAPEGAMSAELGERIRERKQDLLVFLAGLGAGGRVAVQAAFPPCEQPVLSPAQERLLALADLRPPATYHVPFPFEVEGPLDLELLARALASLQRRHDSLRLRFPREGSARSVALDADPPLPFDRVDLRGRSETTVREALAAFLAMPFDLEGGPAWRARWLRTGDQRGILALVAHHLVLDGASRERLLRELGATYRASLEGRDAGLAPPTVRAVDVAAWRRARREAPELEVERAWWSEHLGARPPELRLPYDRAPASGEAVVGENETFVLGESTVARVDALARELRASRFHVVLAATLALLHRTSGQRRMLLCLPVTGRTRRELEPVVGFLNDLLVLGCDLEGDPTLAQLVQRARTEVLAVQEHQDLSFHDLARLPGLVRTRLTRGLVSWRSATDAELDLGPARGRLLPVEEQGADVDLALYLRDEGSTVRGTLRFDRRRFERTTVRELARRLVETLELLLDAPGRSLSSLGDLRPDCSAARELLRGQPGVRAAWVARAPGDDPSPVAWVELDQDRPARRAELREALAALPDGHVPRLLVPVARLPQRSDGTVDEDALPLPAAGESLAPRSALERELAGIWREVLWLEEPPGVRDSFRDLGGHSLLAVELVQRIEEHLGRALPLEALLRLSTIEELAAALEGEDGAQAGPEAAWLERSGLDATVHRGLLAHLSGWGGERRHGGSLLVGLHTDAPGRPFFWCCQGEHEFGQLVRHLGDERPVYAMRSGHRVMDKTRDEVERLARYYVEELLDLQGEGPYLLGGNCQAADVAHAMARELRARGRQVDLLVMQEKLVPAPWPGRVALFFGERSGHDPFRYSRDPEAWWRLLYDGPIEVHRVSGVHGRSFEEPNVQTLARGLREALAAADRGGPPTTPLPALDPPAEARLARIEAPDLRRAAPGERVRLRVKLTNDSCDPWPAGLRLAATTYRRDRGYALGLDLSAPLAESLEPGASRVVPLEVGLPLRSGRYRVEIDLLDAERRAFAAHGREPSARRLRVGKRYLPLRLVRLVTAPLSP